MAGNSCKFNAKIIFALTLVHFMGDFYGSFVHPLLPVFVENLSLTMAQVGLITGTCRIFAFIVQPTVGYFADRYQTRFFALGGLLFSVVFIPLSGLAPSFPVLIFLLALGSIGSAMFHPSVTGMVPLYAGPRAGFSMSLFNTGGTLAFGLGPLFITWYVAAYGLSATPATMIIGLAAFVFLYRILPRPESEGMGRLGFIGSMKESLGSVWKSIALIWLVMVLRAAAGQSFLTFMPVHLAREGHSLVSVGLILSIFVVSGTFSGLIGGYLSDRIGYKPIFFVTHGLMAPALLLFLYLPGNWIYAGAFLAGFFVLATLPLGVVMAQELAPKGRSMVGSLMMGFAYGLGGLVSPLVGKFADIYSIEEALFRVSFIPLLTVVLIFFFPRMRGEGG